nr:PREDICTED: rab effector MyRIP isoform X1 [Lepisosteus oculatus]
MGRKLDLSGLTEEEAEHVLQVVHRDMRLRKKEKERLSEMKQELEEEGSKCTILSKQNKFNDHCCIRCCSPFTFLINTKRQCLDCKFNVCKSCRNYSKKEKAWICSACQKSRLLRTQSLEWYYNNVKSRFKRFGSAKVLKTLYRKHLAERGTLSDVTDGSIHEGSFENEGSICGSDSTFYRQSEGHSMAETLMVALRVAEEAIEEAISKAEEYSDSLEKQNEARYLRDNKEELIEELATTIVQKIIRRRRHSEVKTDFEYEWPRFQSGDMISPTTSENSNLTSQASPSVSYSLWRSQSAFSLTGEDTHEKPTDPDWKVAVSEAIWKQQDEFPTLKKVARPSPLPSWKSMDRLDNSSPSSMLQSPDGNWIALQSALLSRPSLLTKPKSEVFATLEKESGVISAYDELGSDTEDEEYGWNSTFDKLRRQHRKLSDETYYTDSQHDPEWTYTKHGPGPVTSPSSGQYTNTETMCSDSETSSVQSARNSLPRFRKTQLLKRNGLDHHDALDINLNPQSSFQGPVDSSEAEERHSNLRRSRRRRRSKLSLTEQYHESDTLLSTYPMSYSACYQDNAGSLGATVRDESCCPPQRDADVVEVELKAKLCEMACNASDKEPYSEEESDQTKFGAPLPESSPCVREDPALLENVRKEGHNHIDLQPKLQFLSSMLKQKYSAATLCNITTEVLKVLNATEELIEEAAGDNDSLSELMGKTTIAAGTDTEKLDEHLTTLEENVYLAAGSVYGLEGQLGNLEECARSINSVTTENELAHLEDQVASAAAQVHQAELQISDIEQRISALKTAGLNVAPCTRFSKYKEHKQSTQPQTLSTSRRQRRKLPAPPVKDQESRPEPMFNLLRPQ